MDGSAFAQEGTTHIAFHNIISVCTIGTLSPSTVRESFDWARPTHLVDSLELTNHMGFAKRTPQCLNGPASLALRAIFNSPLYCLIFPEADAQ